jgi:hypothetical protein
MVSKVLFKCTFRGMNGIGEYADSIACTFHPLILSMNNLKSKGI